ncbi:MAG: PIN domain-containing protein [Methanobacteriota archaeon]|nr:MAG: PIN domain-containing protein [Euryarchaeota archaeon]
MYCIDASVLTNSVIEEEDHHKFSRGLMERIREEEITVVVPEIAMAEIASAIARGTNDPQKALRFLKELRQLPNFLFIPIDRELSESSSKVAAKYMLRGCDAVYVGVASLFNSKLITLDVEQRKKTPPHINVASPQEELESLGEQ